MKKWLYCLIAACVLTVSCAAPQEETAETAVEEVGERVENAQLSVAIAELDPFFRVVDNSGAKIVLEPADPAVSGRLEIFSESDSMNLVASVEEHKADLLGRENGEFSGQRELMLEAFGTAFYSRGRYTGDDGAAMEETAVFTLHPRGGRLDAVYRYPAGDDSAARLQDQLFSVVAELVYYEETTPDAGAEAAAPDDSQAASDS